jgi:nitrogen fixation protein NifU and related proteins
MDDQQQLYQELLLDHARQPRHKQPLREEAVLADLENPLCGDHIRLGLQLESGRVTAIAFDGEGCVISQASASIMAELVSGRTVAEARQAVAEFVARMRGEAEWPVDAPDELQALSGVRQYPLRVKCATLAWHALEQALDRALDQVADDRSAGGGGVG